MSDLSFRALGKGPTLILIHGFPMNSHVWDEFRIPLSKNFNVITIDLPGFGDSPILKTPFTIDDVASQILNWLNEKDLIDCIIIGHSLGGYVTLSMVEKDPKRIAGFVLLHSTALPDSEEKKQSREKVIDFIEKNGSLAFTSNFIPTLFVDQKHPAIEKVKSISTQSSALAVTAYTTAMKDRPSRIDVLKEFKKPILFIAGEKDTGIPVQTILQQSSVVVNPEVHILKNVAHMAMFEAPDTLANLVSTFAKKCFE
jgi:pimeloyl-ACP methyl ester carboxylesterase